MTGYTQPDLLPFPDNYNDPADVPMDLEALAQATQTALTTVNNNLQYVAPIGTIVMWPQASAPAGWHLCNGTTHGSPALAAVLGGATVTPNLVDKFILGAGAKSVGATGGAPTVTLTAGQSGLRDHGHGINQAGADRDLNHNHGTDSQGSHNHGGYANNYLGSDIEQNPPGTTYRPIGQSPSEYGATMPYAGGHGHNLDYRNLDHLHYISIQGSGWANATEAHENMPPYYVLSYIIRKA